MKRFFVCMLLVMIFLAGCAQQSEGSGSNTTAHPAPTPPSGQSTSTSAPDTAVTQMRYDMPLCPEVTADDPDAVRAITEAVDALTLTLWDYPDEMFGTARTDTIALHTQDGDLNYACYWELRIKRTAPDTYRFLAMGTGGVREGLEPAGERAGS